ncbi:hypothetical protein KAR91_15025 [Candidatus Pacearchaeota archaeon]|nr:hypothetical protein [Candidatus Pacearchaeota archaeon]
MSQSNQKAVRKHIRDNHNILVEARWRRPFRWLPGLHNWKPIILFPKFQFLFTFRMLHEININQPDLPPSPYNCRCQVVPTNKEEGQIDAEHH